MPTRRTSRTLANRYKFKQTSNLSKTSVVRTEVSDFEINIEEGSILVREDVRGASEMLGFNRMYLANEGRFIAFVPEEFADKAAEIMNSHAVDSCATRIGAVSAKMTGDVMKGLIGASSIAYLLELFGGIEQVIFICKAMARASRPPLVASRGT
jgi:hypothetical protein